MPVNNISGIIITLNEESNIVACIVSLQIVCNEIIVVDSGSTDRTVELATSLGAKVYHQPYLGDGIQKNWGIQHASNLWVFHLDADERITPELAEEINQIDLKNTLYEAFEVKRRNYIGSRWIKRCGWYPDALVRLYRHDKTRYRKVKEHASVLSKNKKRLNYDIVHYSFKNIGEVFSKSGRNYSTRGAKILYLKNRKINALTPFCHGLVAFLRCYFIKGGILGGVDGFSISLSVACRSYLKYAKLLEYRRDPTVLAAEDFNNIW